MARETLLAAEGLPAVRRAGPGEDHPGDRLSGDLAAAESDAGRGDSSADDGHVPVGGDVPPVLAVRARGHSEPARRLAGGAQQHQRAAGAAEQPNSTVQAAHGLHLLLRLRPRARRFNQRPPDKRPFRRLAKLRAGLRRDPPAEERQDRPLPAHQSARPAPDLRAHGNADSELLQRAVPPLPPHRPAHSGRQAAVRRRVRAQNSAGIAQKLLRRADLRRASKGQGAANQDQLLPPAPIEAQRGVRTAAKDGVSDQNSNAPKARTPVPAIAQKLYGRRHTISAQHGIAPLQPDLAPTPAVCRSEAARDRREREAQVSVREAPGNPRITGVRQIEPQWNSAG